MDGIRAAGSSPYHVPAPLRTRNRVNDVRSASGSVRCRSSWRRWLPWPYANARIDASSRQNVMVSGSHSSTRGKKNDCCESSPGTPVIDARTADRGGVCVQPEDQEGEGLLRRPVGPSRPRIRSHVAEDGSRALALGNGSGLTQTVEARELDRRDGCFRHGAGRYQCCRVWSNYSAARTSVRYTARRIQRGAKTLW